MNFRTVLWTYFVRKNGTCDVKVYCSHENKKKYFSTGIQLLPKDWDERKEAVRNTHPLAARYNAKITRLRLDIERHFLEGGDWDNLFSKGSKNGLVEFLEKIISEGKDGMLSLTSGTVNNYQSLLTRLKGYEQKTGENITLEGINMAFYQKFTAYLSTHGNCQLPGINKHIKVLKRVMNIGLERKIHQNTVHQEKGFRRPRLNKSDKVFLNEQEIITLENTDLSAQPHLQKELDRWLVAYYFLLRFSDLQEISSANLMQIEGTTFLRYRAGKTQKEATIPVRQRAMKLMETYNFDFSWGTNQQANRQVKMAIAAAGINEMVTQGAITAPKSSIITMHTARRSAATNLYLSGQFSLKTIADLGGWENMKTLQLYLRCSNMDSAKLAAKSEYFR
ncbi:tyrosine-type recombinase/integrase [Lewinella sp. LCG006]|uniref:tyrosine-type recombinase/integrase n=1 Tax=Lewinella sp. LCG006 TaxID=3231911 RepID=UPI003460A4B3